MGLLRLRPKIDRTDSPFQAFARLSLANDSDMLLERLMCILPESDSYRKKNFVIEVALDMSRLKNKFIKLC